NTLHRTPETPPNVSLSAVLRLLAGAQSYKCYLGCHLLIFFHAADDDQITGVGHEERAMIHCWRTHRWRTHCWLQGGLGSVLFYRFPLFGVDVEGKSDGGRPGGTAVVADSVVVIGRVAAAGEIDSGIFFPHQSGAGGDAKAGVAGVDGKVGPFNFGEVAAPWELAHPAFAGGWELGIAIGIFVSAVDVDDGVSEYGARMAEDRSA